MTVVKILSSAIFWQDVQISLLRVIIALLISFFTGVLVAYLIDILNQKRFHYKNIKKNKVKSAKNNYLQDLVLSLVSKSLLGICRFIRQISAFAWLPLIIMFWGIGENALMLTMLISMTFPAILICRDVYAKLSKDVLEEAYCSGSVGLSHFSHIVIPLSIPGFIACIRTLWSIGWHTIIAAEMLGVSDGIGFRLLDFRFLYRYNEMFVYIFFIGILGWLVDHVLEYYEHKIHKLYY